MSADDTPLAKEGPVKSFPKLPACNQQKALAFWPPAFSTYILGVQMLGMHAQPASVAGGAVCSATRVSAFHLQAVGEIGVMRTILKRSLSP